MDFSTIFKTWIFSSETSGLWDVSLYSIKAMTEIEKFTESGEKDPTLGIKALMGVLCKRHVPTDGSTSSSEQADNGIEGIPDEDIHRFAREFIENNKYLIEGQADPLARGEDQSDAEFLMSLLIAENERQSAKLRSTLSSMNNSLTLLQGSKNTAIKKASKDLLEQNKLMEKYYLPKSGIHSLPTLPPNPAYETNDRLGDVTQRLGHLVGFGENALKVMAGIQAAALEFIENFSIEADKNSKTAKIAIWVGISAVVFSMAQIGYTEFWRAPRDASSMGGALASVRGKMDELQNSFSNDLATLKNSQEAISTELVGVVVSSGDTSEALLQSINQLLLQQRERDQAILTALEALTGNVDSHAQ